MTFPRETTTQIKARSVAEAQRLAGQIRSRAQALRTNAAAGNVTSTALTEFLVDGISVNTRLAAIAALSGVAAEANTQLGLADAAAEFTAMTDALTGALTWLVTNLPRDGSDFLLVDQINPATGVVTAREFTPAETAGLRTELDALIATIS